MTIWGELDLHGGWEGSLHWDLEENHIGIQRLPKAYRNILSVPSLCVQRFPGKNSPWMYSNTYRSVHFTSQNTYHIRKSTEKLPIKGMTIRLTNRYAATSLMSHFTLEKNQLHIKLSQTGYLKYCPAEWMFGAENNTSIPSSFYLAIHGNRARSTGR